VITEYVKWRQSLTRLLTTPAGPWFSAMSEELKGQGFSYWILRRRLQNAAHFSQWNQRKGREIQCAGPNCCHVDRRTKRQRLCKAAKSPSSRK